jgi:type I restriction enzyme M protein
VSLHGQELNPESYAICKADMLIKGQDVSQHQAGQHPVRRPAGRQPLRLHAQQPAVRRGVEEGAKAGADEHTAKGFNGSLRPRLPRVSDGSLLFLLHLVSKMRDPREGGSSASASSSTARRCSPAAPAVASREIRRYMLQNDLVETIVALPTDMFYNTGIATYVWVLSQPQGRRSARARCS